VPSVYDFLLFGVMPYIVLLLFIGVQGYRWLVSRFLWTPSSSEVLEKRMIGLSSISLHYGIIIVFIAHILGWATVFAQAPVLLPYFRILATAGALILIYGVLIAFYRRLTNPYLKKNSSAEDYVILLFLLIIPLLGLINDYLLGHFGIFVVVSKWLTSIFVGQPNIELMSTIPLINKIHIFIALLFLCYWPFTKMAGMISFPITYLWRPYQIIRKYRKVFK